MKALLLLAAATLLVSCPSNTSIGPRNARIGWTLPTTYTDGSSLERRDLSAINVYGTDPRRLIAARPGVTTSYMATNLSPGEHCFFVTAVVDTVESDDGDVVCKSIR